MSKFKKLFRFAVIVCAVAIYASSCNERNDFYYTDKNCPIESITVLAEGEEVAGVIDDHYVNLFFETADEFSAVTMDIKVKDGYMLVSPEDPSLVDLTSDAVLIFQTPKGQIKKYFFNLSYAKSVILDGSKITVHGSDASIRVSDLSGTIMIPLDPKTMDQSAITLDFAKGALVDGAKVSQTTFDFTEDLTQSFYIYTQDGGTRKKMSISIDVSGLLSDYRRFDLTDVSTMFVSAEEAEHVQVWTGNSLRGVPVRNIIKEGGSLLEKATFVAETPFVSDYGCEYTDARIYGAIGDWEDSRLTENISGLDIAIVVMDADYYKAKVVAGSGRSIAPGDAGGFVSVTGMPASYQEVVWIDGKAKVEEMLEHTPGSFKLGNTNFFRPALVTGTDGSLSVKTVVRAKADGLWRTWDMTSTSSSLSFDYIKKHSSELKNCQGIATSAPLCILNGHRMNCKEVLYGNFEHYEPAFGQAWNGARMRAYVGCTYDNKIGIAVFNMGNNAERDSEDRRRQCEAVIGTYQGAWLLGKLGWRDVLPIGTAFYLEEEFAPTIVVNGKVVSGKAEQKSAYAITFDKK